MPTLRTPRASAEAEKPTPPAKPGYKTTEFWLTLAAAIAPCLMAAVPAETAATIAGGATAVYTIARTVAKAFGRD